MIEEITRYLGYFLHHVLTNKANIFVLFIYFVIFYLIAYAYDALRQYNEIRNNWDKYKCQPHILPIAGAFMEGSFFDGTGRNFMDCVNADINIFFFDFFKPFSQAIAGIAKIVSALSIALQNMREQLAAVRKLFDDIIAGVFDKVQNSAVALQFYQHKFRNLLKKQFATFKLLQFFVKGLIYTLTSFIDGPIPVFLMYMIVFGILTVIMIGICIICPLGIPFVSWISCWICGLCFSGDSQILVDENSHKPISEIQVGDVIYPNQRVTGKMSFDMEVPVRVYRIGDAWLTGSHLYYDPETKRPIRVEDYVMRSGHLTEFRTVEKVFCISTETNRVYGYNEASGIAEEFGDYYETRDAETWRRWTASVMRSLNGDGSASPTVTSCATVPSGFVEPLFKDAVDITGRTAHIVPRKCIRKYKDILCTTSSIVYDDSTNRWRYVSELEEAVAIYSDSDELVTVYNYVSKSGILTVGGIRYRDFTDTSDKSVYDEYHATSL